jgi:hypothetical protein
MLVSWYLHGNGFFCKWLLSRSLQWVQHQYECCLFSNKVPSSLVLWRGIKNFLRMCCSDIWKKMYGKINGSPFFQLSNVPLLFWYDFEVKPPVIHIRSNFKGKREKLSSAARPLENELDPEYLSEGKVWLQNGKLVKKRQTVDHFVSGEYFVTDKLGFYFSWDPELALNLIAGAMI